MSFFLYRITIQHRRCLKFSILILGEQFSIIISQCLFYRGQTNSVTAGILLCGKVSSAAVFFLFPWTTIFYTNLEHFFYISSFQYDISLLLWQFPTGLKCIFQQISKDNGKVSALER